MADTVHRTSMSGASPSAASGPENPYEKLSREVHKMHSTGAIHQEWLENPKGFLLKPDFKRKAQHVGAGGKKLNVSRGLRLHLGSTYRARWFALDGLVLRYFKNQSEDQELGAIHLTSVNAVLPSSVADAPEFALDLVCADRIYTVAGNNREDMVRWATVLTLVLRGEYKPKLMKRPESTVIRGSSQIPRASARKSNRQTTSRFTDAPRMTTGFYNDDNSSDGKSNDEDVKEKVVTVVFDQPGPLYMSFKQTVDDEIVISGFDEPPSDEENGSVSSSPSSVLNVGDILLAINDYYLNSYISFSETIDMLKNANRPLTLRFLRVEALSSSSSQPSHRVAEGWVLAKEPNVRRYRVRLLQLKDDRLKLYKPSRDGERLPKPCMALRIEGVTDIRPVHDERGIAAAANQFYPKQWGLTLESSRNMFTFFAQSELEMQQWVDVLKNSPHFSPHTQFTSNGVPSYRSSIPVYPVAHVGVMKELEPEVLLEDDLGKLGDLVPTFAVYHFILSADGKLSYYPTREAAEKRQQAIGQVRCDCIYNIVVSPQPERGKAHNSSTDNVLEVGTITTDGSDLRAETMLWRLEMGVVVSGVGHKYKRTMVLCFTSREQMLRWGSTLGREAKRLTGQDYDLSTKGKRRNRGASKAMKQPSGPNTSRGPFSKLMTNPQKYVDPNVSSSTTLGRSLKEVMQKTATKGWFFVRQPNGVGLEAYHPRFLILHKHELFFFKYEVLEDLPDALAFASTSLDLRDVKDVSESPAGFQENLEFTIQLTTTNDVVWMLVAETFAQKETWLATLVWISDFYMGGETDASTLSSISMDSKPSMAKFNNQMAVIRESDEERPSRKSSSFVDATAEASSPAPTPSYPSRNTYESSQQDDTTQVRGQLRIGGKVVFAVIRNGVFSYYDKKEDFDSQWGDAINAFSLTRVEDVHSDGVSSSSFALKVSQDRETQVVAESNTIAKQWMLVICSCAGLILQKTGDGNAWASTKPKEAWVWKLDRLYQVFRRRFVSLRNHELVYMTVPDGRSLGTISLPTIFHVSLSKVCSRGKETADFYQLEINFSVSTPASDDTSQRENGSGIDSFLLAFDSHDALHDWARDIYDCCTNSMALQKHAELAPLGDIQTLPRELLKVADFDLERDPLNENAVVESPPSNELAADGWLFYRTSGDERLRLRYFMLWGFELSIYKHQVLPDETNAIRYGVIDCRALSDVRFASGCSSPENAVNLVLGSGISVTIVPRTDVEAVRWRDALAAVQRVYGIDDDGELGEEQLQIVGSGLYVSRGSTFDTHKDNEELLRQQIEASVLYSANLQDWDDAKWIPKYFVLTPSRVLVLSLAVHLYDEEPDLLGSFPTRDILEVRSCNEAEQKEVGLKSGAAACVVSIKEPKDVSSNWISGAPVAIHGRVYLHADSTDGCYEWMRMICAANGKLELKKNAATGQWGSVNRIATMASHQSFHASAPLSSNRAPVLNTSSIAPSSSPTSDRPRRASRHDAAKRRTSELIKNRKMNAR